MLCLVWKNSSFIPSIKRKKPNILRKISEPIKNASFDPSNTPTRPGKTAQRVVFHFTSLFLVWLIKARAAIGMKKRRFMP